MVPSRPRRLLHKRFDVFCFLFSRSAVQLRSVDEFCQLSLIQKYLVTISPAEVQNLPVLGHNLTVVTIQLICLFSKCLLSSTVSNNIHCRRTWFKLTNEIQRSCSERSECRKRMLPCVSSWSLTYSWIYRKSRWPGMMNVLLVISQADEVFPYEMIDYFAASFEIFLLRKDHYNAVSQYRKSMQCNYSGVTWVSWRLKSPVTPLLDQPLFWITSK